MQSVANSCMWSCSHDTIYLEVTVWTIVYYFVSLCKNKHKPTAQLTKCAVYYTTLNKLCPRSQDTRPRLPVRTPLYTVYKVRCFSPRSRLSLSPPSLSHSLFRREATR